MAATLLLSTSSAIFQIRRSHFTTVECISIDVLVAILADSHFAHAVDALTEGVVWSTGLVAASAVLHGGVRVDTVPTALKTRLAVVALFFIHIPANLSFGSAICRA